MAPPAVCRGLSGEVEEVQPRPTRFRGLVGGAWQRVRTMFRRSSSSAGDAGDEEKPEVAAENSESHPVSLAGDFRILPPSAWQTLHARFLTTKIEQDTFVAGPGQEQASQDLANKPLKPAAGQGSLFRCRKSWFGRSFRHCTRSRRSCEFPAGGLLLEN